MTDNDEYLFTPYYVKGAMTLNILYINLIVPTTLWHRCDNPQLIYVITENQDSNPATLTPKPMFHYTSQE